MVGSRAIRGTHRRVDAVGHRRAAHVPGAVYVLTPQPAFILKPVKCRPHGLVGGQVPPLGAPYVPRREPVGELALPQLLSEGLWALGVASAWLAGEG